ncbi:uncharacterized protein LOC111352967 [Spodoptera litura]|uniref:Uncharacterized protein LOC111352967 n=1 Tax=Spodoptera litura TaxID=69820 RepID=A0A9J7DZL2_SPOLT|nr:uncharacterized protein LOC111352967 [Spodoptera litura]XP_022821479.1 uncharacterized protein LOC111352967 [Spodoptera litura]
MAHITNVPEEVMIMIVKMLDLSDQLNLFNTCHYFRHVLSNSGISKFSMFMNKMATVNILKTHYFKSISANLLELNMQAVPDLKLVKSVLPALKRLNRLKTLDISYTNLNIPDLQEIVKVCPSLKNIVINFVFGRSPIIRIDENMLKGYQELFNHFENIHFVGSLTNLLLSRTVIHMLEKAKLETLKLSAVEYDHMNTSLVERYTPSVATSFDHLALFLVDWRAKRTYDFLSNFPIVAALNWKDYEFCVISTMHVRDMNVCASPKLYPFFTTHFNVKVESVTDHTRNLVGNIALMMWKKETTQFDDIFFNRLYERVKPYFPFYYKETNQEICPPNYDWFFTEPTPCLIDMGEPSSKESKRRKTLVPTVVLDYDHVLIQKTKTQISVAFKFETISAILLPTYADYFQKVTFFSISGGAVNYHSEFFSILFQNFYNLVTLSVECPNLTSRGYSHNICRYIKASTSLKNVRIVDKGIDFQKLFDALSECSTLENINLADLKQWDHTKVADPDNLVRSCTNLYSVFIEALFDQTSLKKQIQLFNKARSTRKRPHLKVMVNFEANPFPFKYNYDPFLDVFQLNPIKPT